MPIEKKVASITFKCTDDKADVLRLKAEERGMTLSEYMDDITQQPYERAVKFGLRMASHIRVVNVNDISKGYTVNEQKRTRFSFQERPGLKLVASN